MSQPDILPRCTARDPKVTTYRDGVAYYRLVCASCDADGGEVSEGLVSMHGFAFYLCIPCEKKYGVPVGAMRMPDEVFWDRVRQEMLDKYGRLLSADELLVLAADGNSTIGKLLRDRKE